MDVESNPVLGLSDRADVVLLTRHQLLGQLLQHFLANLPDLSLSLQSLPEDIGSGNALLLLDTASVDCAELSRVLALVDDGCAVALVNTNPEQAEQILEQFPWVRGVFYSHVTREHLLQGIRALLAGNDWLPRPLMERLVGQLRSLRGAPQEREEAELTRRELEIMQLVGKGLSNTDVAALLNLSPHTIKSHVHNLLRKLGVSNRAEAVYLLRDQLGRE
ncbi:hypothetical protein AX279_24340 [Pseudomonas sp. J237]|nr:MULTISPECIES: response regulator transcription factor [Pseudomonas]OEO23438.1 hypothetical protein AX279_24340 [Pseudomonas sp. J237]